MNLWARQRDKFHEVMHAKSKVVDIECCILVLRLSQLPTLYHSCESGNICKTDENTMPITPILKYLNMQHNQRDREDSCKFLTTETICKFPYRNSTPIEQNDKIRNQCKVIKQVP